MESKPYQVLRRKSDFEKLYRSGYKLYPSPWMTLNVQPTSLEVIRCGWTVPRRVGNAVIRNKLKRWCRVFFRNVSSVQRGVDINIVFRGVNNSGDFYRRLTHPEFVACLEKGWRKALIFCESDSQRLRNSHD